MLSKVSELKQTWYTCLYYPYIYGHKSHIGQKKCFTPKYEEKCIYLVLTEHTLYYERWTHIKVPIFSESLQSKDSIGTVTKPNDTGCANYTEWNIEMIMHFCQIQHPHLYLNITMESKIRHHFWKNTIGTCHIRIKFISPTFGGENTGW